MDKERIKKALSGAIASRGKHKGRLKATCPAMGSDEALMWQALMMNQNPYKVGMGHLVLMTKEQKEFFDDCLAFSDSIYKQGYIIDKDREALENLGVW